jgi:hypothetical protein
VKKDKEGRVLGIAAEIPAFVEYALPPGALRFRATGVVESNGRGQKPGPLQFLVVVGTPDNTAITPGLPVPVDLAELGLPGTVRIRDLWAHRDLGEFKGGFSPEIPWHGAGLYRITAVATAK